MSSNSAKGCCPVCTACHAQAVGKIQKCMHGSKADYYTQAELSLNIHPKRSFCYRTAIYLVLFDNLRLLETPCSSPEFGSVREAGPPLL